MFSRPEISGGTPGLSPHAVSLGLLRSAAIAAIHLMFSRFALFGGRRGPRGSQSLLRHLKSERIEHHFPEAEKPGAHCDQNLRSLASG
jgi:hypothetical protein